MRTLATTILSLKWRIILTVTVCFIGLYLLTTDDLPRRLAPINIPAKGKAVPPLDSAIVDDGVDKADIPESAPAGSRPDGTGPGLVDEGGTGGTTTPSSSRIIEIATTTTSTAAGIATGAAQKNKTPDDNYVSVCMAVKNQREDLPEFLIHHYYHLNIRHFYIMDDGSEPPLSEMGDDELGIPRDAVTFEYQDQATRSGWAQMDIYRRCLDQYGPKHTWMAFLDGDEFLEATGNETLVDVLMDMETDDTIGVLGVNWRMHTSSGLLTRPASARKSFVDCLWDDDEHNGAESDNRHVKGIARISHVVAPLNPHSFIVKDGARTVGENKDTLEESSFRMPITRNRLSLHHYAVKSLEEYELKKNRGNAMTQPKGDDFWDHIESAPQVKCPELARYNP